MFNRKVPLWALFCCVAIALIFNTCLWNGRLDKQIDKCGDSMIWMDTDCYERLQLDSCHPWVDENDTCIVPEPTGRDNAKYHSRHGRLGT